MRLSVTKDKTHYSQAWVRSDWESISDMDWCDKYVNFSGFFGKYGPEMFALAPDMVELLRDTYNTLNTMTSDDYAMGADAPIRDRLEALFAKLEGDK